MVVCIFSEVVRKRLWYVLLLCVAGFWCIFYPHHVLYQESYNLFFFTSAFAERYVCKPGGWSEYAGAFLMQFFRYLWIGVLLNVLVFGAVQRSVASLFRQWGIFRQWYVWTWLPALGVLGLQMNYDFLFGETVQVVLFFVFLAFLGKIKGEKLGLLLPWLMAPLLLLFLGGGLYLLFYLLWGLKEVWVGRKGKNGYVVLGGLLFAGGVWWFWRDVYPMPDVWLYEFFPDSSRVQVIAGTRILLYGFAGVLVAGKILPELKWEKPKEKLLMMVVGAGLLTACVLGLWKYNYRPGVEHLLHAELAVANEDWKGMAELSEANRYEIPTFIALANLSLAKEGQLADRMFEFPQVGTEGLILPAGANYLVNLFGHEIFYQLGQDNEAYRYLFEAYNCKAGRVSGHMLKRMAELLIRIEKTAAAEKILVQLTHTLFYRAWAREKLREIAHFVSTAPSGGMDFYPGFSGAMVDLMNMQRQDPDNKLLQEYLLAACLLEKQIPVFYHFFTRFYPAGVAGYLPRHYEEALFIVLQSGLDKAVLEKYKISAEQFRRLSQYSRAYKSLHKSPEAARLLADDFGDTYWYYMHFKKKNS